MTGRPEFPPLPCPAETRWHKLDSRNYCWEVGGVTIAVILGPAPILVHDWTIQIGNGAYGLMEWQDSSCTIYVHHGIVTLPFSAPVVAGGLLLFVLLLLFAGGHFIGNLRHRDAPGDE
jgi:hypothetical protein